MRIENGSDVILAFRPTQGPRLGGVAKGDAAADVRDRLTADVEFAVNVCHLYRPHVQLKACARILEYLHSLPMEKADARRAQAADAGVKDMTEGSAPFALEVHTTRQLCHFKLLLVNFVSTLLSSKRLIEQLVELDDADRPALEPLYRHLIETALQYTQVAQLFSRNSIVLFSFRDRVRSGRSKKRVALTERS